MEFESQPLSMSSTSSPKATSLVAAVGLVLMGTVLLGLAQYSSVGSALYAKPLLQTSTRVAPVTMPLYAATAQTDQDKEEVEKYFEDTSKDGGFDRWRRIYGDEDNVNAVQKDIREGHQITVDKVLYWFDTDRQPIKGKTVADLGCGTGSLAVPLAKKGAVVSASDISGPMAEATLARAKAQGVDLSKFEAYKSDLESVKGQYDTVTCIDVLIHYPEDKMQQMVSHLSSLAKERIIISFAPKIWYYELLKKVGSLFPGPSKTTRAYLHSEDKVVAALRANGFEPERRDLTATSFYFSRVIEAKRK